MKYRNNQRTNLVSIIDGSSGDDEWVAKRWVFDSFPNIRRDRV